MAYSHTQKKTKQQKIQASQRHLQTPTKLQSDTPTTAPAVAEDATASVEATASYYSQELVRIGWISLICLGLLAIATLWLSPLEPFVQFRAWLSSLF